MAVTDMLWPAAVVAAVDAQAQSMLPVVPAVTADSAVPLMKGDMVSVLPLICGVAAENVTVIIPPVLIRMPETYFVVEVLQEDDSAVTPVKSFD